MAEWTVKAVDGEEVKSAQEQEQAVVEAAVEDQPNIEVENNEPIKVNLDEPAAEEPAAETPTEDAEQRNQEGDNEEVDEEQILELLTDEEEPAQGEQLQQDPVQAQEPQQEEVAPPRVLPEDVDKLIQFMEDTGGTVEDYAKLNRDLESLDDVSTIREYYREKYPHMSEDRISRKMDKNFLYDAEADEADAIQDKKDLFEDELYEARNFLKGRKDKYYADLKLNKQNSLDPEVKEAYDFYNEYKTTQESNERLVEKFQHQTKQVFNDDFKGFDFKVGDNKYRYKVADREEVMNYQSDLNNFIGEFTSEDGSIGDPAGYHKAMWAAKNADRIAQHFYEQGKADAVREAAKKSKNIDMNPRSDASAVVTPSGNKVRVVSGDSSSGLKFKMRNTNR